MTIKNKQTPRSEKYKSIRRKEVDESKIKSLLDELLEDYKSREIVSFKESVLKPDANPIEEAAKAIKDLLAEHGIVLEDKKYHDMAKSLLDTVNRIASSSN